MVASFGRAQKVWEPRSHEEQKTIWFYIFLEKDEYIETLLYFPEKKMYLMYFQATLETALTFVALPFVTSRQFSRRVW